MWTHRTKLQYRKKPKAMEKHTQQTDKFHNVELKMPACSEDIKNKCIFKAQSDYEECSAHKTRSENKKKKKFVEMENIRY